MTRRCYHSPEKANIGGERNCDSFRGGSAGVVHAQEIETIHSPRQASLAGLMPLAEHDFLFCTIL
ncbi:TPA: hypothetical protein JGA48_004522 [Salmonella enterica]|nr:hypothetical protein [Salmonella enterica]